MCCACLWTKHKLKKYRNDILRKEKLLKIGMKKVNEELDAVNLLQWLWKLDLQVNTLFNSNQKLLLNFQWSTLLDDEYTSDHYKSRKKKIDEVLRRAKTIEFSQLEKYLINDVQTYVCT